MLRIAAIVLLLGACGAAQEKPGQTASRRQGNVISLAEIQEASGPSNAYELIQRLRPQFLRTRGAQSLREPGPPLLMVYQDGLNIGSLATLRHIPVTIIQEIRFLSPSDATTKYGTGHGGGALEITTRSK